MKTSFLTESFPHIEEQNTTSRRTGSTSESIKPLKLDLQFFAEEDDPADPPGGDDETVKTLAEAFKLYPHLRTEHKRKVTEAIQDRFKKYDFDPDEAKAALAKVKALEESGGDKAAAENAELTKAKAERDKLLNKTKSLLIASMVADDVDPKLFIRLAGDKLEGLDLDENFNLEKEKVEEVMADLRDEFPTVFVAAATGKEEDEPETPEAKKKAGYNPGDQKLNKPDKGGDDEAAKTLMADILDRNKRNIKNF